MFTPDHLEDSREKNQHQIARWLANTQVDGW